LTDILERRRCDIIHARLSY